MKCRDCVLTDIQRDGKWWFCKIWPEDEIEQYPEPEYPSCQIYDGYTHSTLDERNRDCVCDDRRKAKLREQLER